MSRRSKDLFEIAVDNRAVGRRPAVAGAAARWRRHAMARPLVDGVARRGIRGICQYLLGIFGVLRGESACTASRERIPAR